jgi:hypothetical protein
MFSPANPSINPRRRPVGANPDHHQRRPEIATSMRKTDRARAELVNKSQRQPVAKKSPQKFRHHRKNFMTE